MWLGSQVATEQHHDTGDDRGVQEKRTATTSPSHRVKTHPAGPAEFARKQRDFQLELNNTWRPADTRRISFYRNALRQNVATSLFFNEIGRVPAIGRLNVLNRECAPLNRPTSNDLRRAARIVRAKRQLSTPSLRGFAQTENKTAGENRSSAVSIVFKMRFVAAT
jgi:hypothetical protein